MNKKVDKGDVLDAMRSINHSDLPTDTKRLFMEQLFRANRDVIQSPHKDPKIVKALNLVAALCSRGIPLQKSAKLVSHLKGIDKSWKAIEQRYTGIERQYLDDQIAATTNATEPEAQALNLIAIVLVAAFGTEDDLKKYFGLTISEIENQAGMPIEDIQERTGLI